MSVQPYVVKQLPSSHVALGSKLQASESVQPYVVKQFPSSHVANGSNYRQGNLYTHN